MKKLGKILLTEYVQANKNDCRKMYRIFNFIYSFKIAMP